MGSYSGVSTPHALLFPLMSKGHTVPFLHLAHLLLRRGISVTVVTTPANKPFISNYLSTTTAVIITLPFPENIPEIPSGVESTDKLPSMSLFAIFANATKLMHQDFEKAIEKILPVSFLVSDGFLPWTLYSAEKFSIPRFAMYGTNNYSMAMVIDMMKNDQFSKIETDDELFAMPSFPRIKLTKNDFDPPIKLRNLNGPQKEFFINVHTSTSNSHGVLVNSFYELEPEFVDYWNRESETKAFCVGPLYFAEPPKIQHEQNPNWLHWLNQKLNEGTPVLYVAFGSQSEISQDQIKQIANGLEQSNVNFLWIMKENLYQFEDGFEDRVKDRGIVVTDWVNQREILAHEIVTGFLSHCGWNSCLESICAGVPILAFPLAAEQHLNARFVVEEMKIGLRVETCDGTVRGLVKGEGLERNVRELMEGEKGNEVRKKVKEIGEAAKKAVEEGGSSCQTLDQLIQELCEKTTLLNDINYTNLSI